MMGRLNHDQRQLFYSFRLEDAVPDDHLVRAIAGVLDLSWVHAELAPHYPKLGRPSIDPVLMILREPGYILLRVSPTAVTKPQWEFPRLCRGGSKSLTYAGGRHRRSIDETPNGEPPSS
jgi:hypothetical protein